jgi:DNA helicase II / ATP-dependent DNA helicase PcrA
MISPAQPGGSKNSRATYGPRFCDPSKQPRTGAKVWSKSVFVLNCVDGCIPSDRATGSTPEIEEERRLLYVAMTRAEDYLQMIVPQRFFAHQQRMNGDRHMYAQRTRFISDAMLNHFERCAWPPAVHESSSRASSPPKPVDLGARLKQMWR